MILEKLGKRSLAGQKIIQICNRLNTLVDTKGYPYSNCISRVLGFKMPLYRPDEV